MTVTLPLDEMTVHEKFQSRPDELQSPAWHGEVLRERQRQVEAGETNFMPWE